MENCQNKAHDYEPCDSSFIENPRTVNGLLIPNNELQNFKELYRGYDYNIIKHDEEYYFAYDFVSLKEKQAKILAQGIAEINSVKPFYLSSYSQKSKHPKTTAQKQNECKKRRSKNKAARKAKKRK